MDFSISNAFNIVIEKLETWLESLTAMLPNMVVALLILIVFFFLARITRNLTQKGLNKFSDRKALNSLITTTLHVLIIGAGVMIALSILQLDKAVSSLLAGAGIIGLALGFAFQDIAANYMSGILMAIRKPIVVGDIIETNGYMGVVEKISLRVTTIRTFQGLHVIIPNKEVFQNPVTNYTKTNVRRIDLECGVSYGDDLEKVKEIAESAIEKQDFYIKDEGVNLFFTSFGDSSINFSLRFWIEYPDQPGFMKSRSEAIMALKRAFDENDIAIPYPIRTLDFGIKGGEKLSDMNVMSKSA